MPVGLTRIILDHIIRHNPTLRKFMNKQELRDYCRSIRSLNTIESCQEMLTIFQEFMLLVIQKHNKEAVDSQAKADAKILLQMVFTKAVQLNKLLDGVEFDSRYGGKLDNIIDPTAISVIIRNLYETVALFHLVYTHPDSEDKHSIVYNLWVSSGLSYRQRFSATFSTSVERLTEEAQIIDQIKSEIEKTELFQSLSEPNKGKINNKLRAKDYKICFEGNEIKFLSWQDITSTMNLKNDLFDHMYNYFSLYAHPSNVSVFQFDQMFSPESQDFIGLTKTSMKYCSALLSIFTADYIKLFPHIIETYNAMEIQDQILLNFHNHMMRPETFSINDSWKALG